MHIAGKVAKHFMLDESCGAMNDHHARGGAVVERARGDEFLGQVVVEIFGRKAHAGDSEGKGRGLAMEFRSIVVIFSHHFIRVLPSRKNCPRE